MESARRKVSYLHARDPSILSHGCSNLHKVKCQLKDYWTASIISEENNEKSIEVFLRIKCGDLLDMYSITDTTVTCKLPSNGKNSREGEQIYKTYSFSKIFPPTTEQKEIFDHIVKPRVLNFINGKSTTLLTYGASGAGKTFTIMGTTDDPGLIPRVLEYLFRSISDVPEKPSVKPKPDGTFQWLDEEGGSREVKHLHSLLGNITNKTVLETTYQDMQRRLSCEPVAELSDNDLISIGVWISFAEIYNEHVYDLLDWNLLQGTQRPKLKICNNQGSTYIKNLKHVYVSSGIHAFKLLQMGLTNLNYAATSINSHSSRSHSIFTIKLVHAYSKDDVKVSQFHFCDLAGSERSKKTNNIGERLKESNNINTSLLVLGRCISKLRSIGQKHNETKQLVPFRESKLTQLFQKALTGLEDIMMIVNVNPVKEMFDESVHALNFSAIAREVKIENKQVSQAAKRKADDDEVELLKMENEDLRRQLNDAWDIIDETKEDAEEKESNARLELTKYYTEYIEKIKEEHEIRLSQLKKQIQELKRDQLQHKKRKLDESVISLDSSSCDDISQTETSSQNDESMNESFI